MRRLALAALLILGPPGLTPALPWGDNGHIAVAKVADCFLSPMARAAIRELIPSEHIYDRSIAVYADWFKHTPAGAHTRAWHYVDIPLDAPHYSAERDCRNDNCVIVQLPAERAILRDKTRPRAERQLALKLVVHFYGDLHQPLHCAERNHDAGGNEVAVRLRDQHGIRNLHSVWDSDLVDENLKGADPEDHGGDLAKRVTGKERALWESVTDPTAMAEEGHQLAITFCYAGVPVGSGAPHSLNEKYIEAAKRVVEEQIQKGGVRLARALNEDLKN